MNDAMNHPKAPHNQTFNLKVKHTDKRGWWLQGHNKPVKRGDK